MKEKKTEVDNGKITGFFDKNTDITGDLKFSGSFQIDGHFHGTIDSKAILIVGENGKIEADINIGIIVINGEVKGNITAVKRVEINSTGRLIGTVTSPNLVVQEGAHLEATCHTTDKKKTLEPQGEKTPPAEAGPEVKEGFLS